MKIFCLKCNKIYDKPKCIKEFYRKKYYKIYLCPKCETIMITKYPFHNSIFQPEDSHGNLISISRICYEFKRNLSR